MSKPNFFEAPKGTKIIVSYSYDEVKCAHTECCKVVTALTKYSTYTGDLDIFSLDIWEGKRDLWKTRLTEMDTKKLVRYSIEKQVIDD